MFELGTWKLEFYLMNEKMNPLLLRNFLIPSEILVYVSTEN